jgi:hypothetical protein
MFVRVPASAQPSAEQSASVDTRAEWDALGTSDSSFVFPFGVAAATPAAPEPAAGALTLPLPSAAAAAVNAHLVGLSAAARDDGPHHGAAAAGVGASGRFTTPSHSFSDTASLGAASTVSGWRPSDAVEAALPTVDAADAAASAAAAGVTPPQSQHDGTRPATPEVPAVPAEASEQRGGSDASVDVTGDADAALDREEQLAVIKAVQSRSFITRDASVFDETAQAWRRAVIEVTNRGSFKVRIYRKLRSNLTLVKIPIAEASVRVCSVAVRRSFMRVSAVLWRRGSFYSHHMRVVPVVRSSSPTASCA